VLNFPVAISDSAERREKFHDSRSRRAGI